MNTEIETGGAQQKWLEADLKAHKDYTFKVAAYHKPFFPHSRKKAEKVKQFKEWAGLFYEYGLDLSMDADSHLHKITYSLKPSTPVTPEKGFVRDDEKGIMFMGEGSWGATPRPDNDLKSWTLESGSFNQLKWVHVWPEARDKQAFMEIFTIPTTEKGKNKSVIALADQLEELSDENPFEIQNGIKLFSGDESRRSVKYPFHLNLK